MLATKQPTLLALLVFSFVSTLGAGAAVARQRVKGHPVPLQQLSGYHCTALSPAGWSVVGGRAEGDSLDVARNDRKAFASYVIIGVTSLMRPGPAYATPESTVATVLTQVGQSPVSFGQRRQSYGYTVVSWRNGRGRGTTLYRTFPLPSDPGGFIIAMRSGAIGPAESKRSYREAMAVATSIRCAVQLVAHTSSSSSSSAQRHARDESDEASLYNKELGMEYAHSEKTGQNYWVSPSTDFTQNGPEGPGYYDRNGNKLIPGRSD
jgi:hypothetical protein